MSMDIKKPRCFQQRGFVLKAWQCPTFTWDLPHYHRR